LSLASRIRQSRRVAAGLGATLAAYLRLCHATTRWQSRGEEALHAALAEGPVVVMLWHSRLMLSGPNWPRDRAQLAVLHDTSPVGRAAGEVQRRFGLDPVAISPRASNLVNVRDVLRRLKAGHSIGLTVDGPLGPAHRVSDAALEWARVAGRPVFVMCFSVARQRRLGSWDRMLMPLPRTEGAIVFRRWEGSVPRHPDGQTIEALRTGLGACLTAAGAEADALVGLPPGP